MLENIILMVLLLGFFEIFFLVWFTSSECYSRIRNYKFSFLIQGKSFLTHSYTILLFSFIVYRNLLFFYLTCHSLRIVYSTVIWLQIWASFLMCVTVVSLYSSMPFCCLMYKCQWMPYLLGEPCNIKGKENTGNLFFMFSCQC